MEVTMLDLLTEFLRAELNTAADAIRPTLDLFLLLIIGLKITLFLYDITDRISSAGRTRKIVYITIAIIVLFIMTIISFGLWGSYA